MNQALGKTIHMYDLISSHLKRKLRLAGDLRKNK